MVILKKLIKEVARHIGMQNQELGFAVAKGRVIGDIVGSYHSDESWVEVHSVKEYMLWKLENYIINEQDYSKAIEFLNSL